MKASNDSDHNPIAKTVEKEEETEPSRWQIPKRQLQNSCPTTRAEKSKMEISRIMEEVKKAKRLKR